MKSISQDDILILGADGHIKPHPATITVVAQDREPIARILLTGTIHSGVAQLTPDMLDDTPGARERGVIAGTVYTNGTMVWSDASIYYLRKYGLIDRALLAQCWNSRAGGFEPVDLKGGPGEQVWACLQQPMERERTEPVQRL